MKWYSVVFVTIMGVLAAASGGFGVVSINAGMQLEGLVMVGAAFLLLFLMVLVVSTERRFGKETAGKQVAKAVMADGAMDFRCDCWQGEDSYIGTKCRIDDKNIQLKYKRKLDVTAPIADVRMLSSSRGSDGRGSNMTVRLGSKVYDLTFGDLGAFDYVKSQLG